jgi:hypothetical protein
VKEFLVAVVDILFPDNSNDMNTIRLSCRTATKCIDELAADIEQKLRDRASKSEALSFAIHESTIGIADVPILAG